MARPKVPLISRRKALDEAALGIIDNGGLKALSIRRLGEVMNVNGASLYHHFASKDEILVGVTQLALADVTAPRSDSDNWRVWLPLNAYLHAAGPDRSPGTHPHHASPGSARHRQRGSRGERGPAAGRRRRVERDRAR